MKAVTPAGGFEMKIFEERDLNFEPRVKISNLPIVWHMIEIYFHHNFNELIMCLKYELRIIEKSVR